MNGADVIVSTAPVYWIMQFVFFRMQIAALCILKRINRINDKENLYGVNGLQTIFQTKAGRYDSL